MHQLIPLSCPQKRCSLARRGRGYSLLELMLALALLGTLLTVAWSLMGTYRDAEERGWQLSMRTQTVRAIHEWLQQDLDQIASTLDSSPVGASTPNDLSTASSPFAPTISPKVFSGDSTGFKVSIEPALNPLPFLERLMTTSDSTISNSLTTTSDSESPRVSPWSQDRLVVEYRLAPSSGRDLQSALPITAVDGEDRDSPQFQLTRTARRPHSSSLADPEADEGQTLSDRLLSSQDLYGTTEEEQGIALGAPVEESSLHGLENARFQYFDGRSWLDEWNSPDNRLPQAVVLSFDLPRRFESTAARMARLASEPALEESMDPEPSIAVEGLASEPIAEIDTGTDDCLLENDSHQVHIVVRTGGSP